MTVITVMSFGRRRSSAPSTMASCSSCRVGSRPSAAARRRRSDHACSRYMIITTPVSAAQLGEIVDLIGAGTISGKIAKDVFEIVWTEGGSPAQIVETRGMKQVTDTGAIEKAVDEIIAANPDKAAAVAEKPQAIGWFVGQVMKATGGKANPAAVNDILRAKLGL